MENISISQEQENRIKRIKAIQERLDSVHIDRKDNEEGELQEELRKLVSEEKEFVSHAREINNNLSRPVINADRSQTDILKGIIQIDKTRGVWDIAEYLILKYKIKTIGNRDNTKEIYLYEGGYYRVDYGIIKKEIIDITESSVSSHTREEIIKVIKEKTYMERKYFSVEPEYINLKNGIYNVRSKEFSNHDPDKLFLHQIPASYNKDADCPKIKEFLNQILDEESIKVVQEWFGYCLYRKYFIKKAIIFVGEKDTGKTTVLKLKARFLGGDNISGVSLQKISSDKFALSNLYQKHANIYDDLSFKDINDNGTFKMLAGNGPTTAERKFGDQFQFENYAKLTFSCNKIPKILDSDDEAYFSRWIIIRFEHSSKKPDKFLIDKITTNEELSGLLNFALEGLERILHNQNFSYSKSAEEIKKEMCMSASSLAKFVYDELEAVSDVNYYLTKDDLYQEFVNYASRNDLPIIPKETLGKNLPQFITVGAGRKSLLNKETGKKKQYECWIGIKLKNGNFTPPKEAESINDPFSFDQV